jgi:hypothetical protein
VSFRTTHSLSADRRWTHDAKPLYRIAASVPLNVLHSRLQTSPDAIQGSAVLLPSLINNLSIPTSFEVARTRADRLSRLCSASLIGWSRGGSGSVQTPFNQSGTDFRYSVSD